MQAINASNRKTAAEDLISAVDFKFFKTMSEPVRMQILKFLLLNGRSDIATIAEGMPQDRSVISRHLNLMSEVSILRCKKETRHVFYEIDGTVFLDKLETMTQQIRQCIPVCCPECLK
jgi:DNA-binding transcriptional ArsR family regulator